MTFHPVASADDLLDGKPLAVDVNGTPVCLVRADGEVFAINDICSHGQVSLSEGEVDDCTLECWLHGSRFDLRTGAPVSLPAVDAVPVYAVRIEGGQVLVEIPEA
jgi:3-phenylpropionate/trans-cinnamate dioxygenase ferredoxin subunit